MLPILFQNNQIVLYSYPLFMGLAWGIGYQFFFYHIKSEERLKAQILFWGVFISAWIGAKLLFIITSGDKIASEFFSTTNFWMGGGFVFYGGLIGGAFYLLAYQLITRINEEWVKWAAISLALGHGIGRMGCFLAGCCYGEATDWWWGIHLHGEDRHPAQLLEALALITLAQILRRFNNPWTVVGVYSVYYGLVRFGLEFLRGDQLRGIWAWSLSPSQWISLVIVILGTYSLLAKRAQVAK